MTRVDWLPEGRDPLPASEERRRGEALWAVFDAAHTLDPDRQASLAERRRVSDTVIRAMAKWPEAAHAMLVPLVKTALSETDEEVLGNTVKALGLLRELGLPGSVEEATEQGYVYGDDPPAPAVERSPDEVIDLIVRDNEPLQSPEEERARVLYILFGEGVLEYTQWPQSVALARWTDLMQNERFAAYVGGKTIKSRQTQKEVMEEWKREAEWLYKHSGLVPARWADRSGIASDLKDTRSYDLPAELITALLDHPHPKIAVALAKHQRLNFRQKARIVAREDVNLKPDPATFFWRHEADSYLTTRRRRVDERRRARSSD